MLIFLIFFKLKKKNTFCNFSCNLLPLQVEGKYLKQVSKWYLPQLIKQMMEETEEGFHKNHKGPS